MNRRWIERKRERGRKWKKKRTKAVERFDECVSKRLKSGFIQPMTLRQSSFTKWNVCTARTVCCIDESVGMKCYQWWNQRKWNKKRKKNRKNIGLKAHTWAYIAQATCSSFKSVVVARACVCVCVKEFHLASDARVNCCVHVFRLMHMAGSHCGFLIAPCRCHSSQTGPMHTSE